MESIQIRLERLIDRFGSSWDSPKRSDMLSLCLRYACTEMPSEFINSRQVKDRVIQLASKASTSKETISLLSKLSKSKFIKHEQPILVLLIKLAGNKKQTPFSTNPILQIDRNQEDSDNKQINKDGLFQDILSVYQGIDNLNIVYSRKFDMYILKKESPLEMTTSAQKMLSSLCEVGWLYRVISLGLNKLMKRRDSLVVQSFYTAVKDTLNEFYRHLMVLDVHYRRVYLNGNRFFFSRLKKFNSEMEFKMKTLAELVEAGLPLDPHQILSYLYSVSRNALPQEHYSLARLSELAQLIKYSDHTQFESVSSKTRSKKIQSFNAEELQAKVNSPMMVFNSIGVDPGLEENELSFDPKLHAKRGPSKNEQDFLLNIFRKSCKSLVEFVNTWVFRGEILDPKSEFFVQLNSGLPSPDQFWGLGMFFKEAKVPSFLDQTHAEMIFKTGKIQRLFKKLEQGGFGNNYIRERRALLITQRNYQPKRKSLFWTRVQEYINGPQARMLKTKSRIELDEMIASNSSQSLNSKLNLYFSYSNSLLLHHFFIDRDGLLVFQFLKMTFLLTRGDFSSAFLDSIHSEVGFGKPRQTMTHQIMMCLEQALASSIKKNVEDPYAEEFQDFYRGEGNVNIFVNDTRIENTNQIESINNIDNQIKQESETNKSSKIQEEKNIKNITPSKTSTSQTPTIFGDAFKKNYKPTIKIQEENDKFLLCDDLGIRFYEKQHGFIQQFVNFSLYLPEFEFPLNNVFSKSVLRKYSLVFQYLFSLKTIQYRLRTHWLHSVKIMRKRHSPSISRLLLLLHAFQNKLRGFFDGVIDFYMVDVIMVCWEKFKGDLRDTLDFEKLIQTHQKFVYVILEKLSLDFDDELTKKRRTRLRSALAQIFRNFQEYVQVEQFVMKNLVDSTLANLDASESFDDEQRLENDYNREGMVKESFAHLFKVEKTFSKAVLEFTACLNEKEFEIRNDFNEYYVRDTRSFK